LPEDFLLEDFLPAEPFDAPFAPPFPAADFDALRATLPAVFEA
jgi:hypothetical protein